LFGSISGCSFVVVICPLFADKIGFLEKICFYVDLIIERLG